MHLLSLSTKANGGAQLKLSALVGSLIMLTLLCVKFPCYKSSMQDQD